MEILGRYGPSSVILRCCSEGKWGITQPMRGSGCMHCVHDGTTMFYDYLNLEKLEFVEDENVIKEALEPSNDSWPTIQKDNSK